MEGGKCLWQHILIHKYKLERDGWFVPGRDYKASGIWRLILSVKVFLINGLGTKLMMGSVSNSGWTSSFESAIS